MGGQRVHHPWPPQVSSQQSRPQQSTPPKHSLRGQGHIPIAFQGEASKIYNLLNDQGLQINARYRKGLRQGTHIDAVGVLAIGRGGYSRIHVATDRMGRFTLRINGRALVAGQSTRLADGGLLTWPAALLLRLRGQVAFVSGRRVQLTDAGRRLGNSLVRAHRLWETYLDQHFELPADHLHEPASRIEHFIGPALQEKLARELEVRQVDPHGRSIPPSDR